MVDTAIAHSIVHEKSLTPASMNERRPHSIAVLLVLAGNGNKNSLHELIEGLRDRPSSARDVAL